MPAFLEIFVLSARMWSDQFIFESIKTPRNFSVSLFISRSSPKYTLISSIFLLENIIYLVLLAFNFKPLFVAQCRTRLRTSFTIRFN